MSNEASTSYRRSRVRRNGCRHRLLVEAPTGEQPSSREPRPAPGDDPSGPLAFGLQGGKRLLDRVAANALSLQIEPDRGVSLATLGQRAGAIRREPEVVH